MPEFVNPFTGVVPGKKLTRSELARGIRLSLAAEEEAAHLYNAIADATDNEFAATVLRDIADEERVHKGEFQRLLTILLEDEQSLMDQGAAEVDEIYEQLKNGNAVPPKGKIPTVGSLREP
jgi:rubrerythrin